LQSTLKITLHEFKEETQVVFEITVESLLNPRESSQIADIAALKHYSIAELQQTSVVQHYMMLYRVM